MSQPIVESIAQEVGVSQRTVLRVLSGQARDKRPSIQLRFDRIRRLAAERDYRPNAAARATRTGRFNNVALILGCDGYRSHLPDQLLAGIHDGLEASGEHLVVARLTDAQLSDDEYMPRFLAEWMCDGLIINYHVAVPPRLAEMVAQYKVPAVWVNVRRAQDCVLPDDVACGRLAAEHLLSQGHRRITYCDFTWNAGRKAGLEHHSRGDRFAGYSLAMRHAGLSPDLFSDAEQHESTEHLLQRIDHWLVRPDRPTAVVCNGGEWRLIERRAFRTGLRLPEDLSMLVAGMEAPRDEIGGAVLPLREIGRVASVKVVERIVSGASGFAPIVLAPQLNQGLSVARAPEV